ncbi:MAG: two-component system regulatory protein YycI [Thermoclostridium sp.]|nr:two-component system regulatory protein YycI [Thermoclostridium sp.]
MNWRRAKNILLMVLVLLNVFLFINVLSVKDPFDITGKYQKDAKKALQAAGVTVSGNIPSSSPVGRISFSQREASYYTEFVHRLTGLNVEDSAWASDNIFNNGGTSLSFSDENFTLETSEELFPTENTKKLDQKLKSWLREKFGNEAFVQDGFAQNGDTITAEYVRKYKNLPLFAQRITFTITNNRLAKMEGSLKLLYDIKASKSTNEIISPNIVLLTGKDKVQGIVSSIDLGYLSLQGDDLYDTPVWRITLASGEKAWFNAYTGEFLE